MSGNNKKTVNTGRGFSGANRQVIKSFVPPTTNTTMPTMPSNQSPSNSQSIKPNIRPQTFDPPMNFIMPQSNQMNTPSSSNTQAIQPSFFTFTPEQMQQTMFTMMNTMFANPNGPGGLNPLMTANQNPNVVQSGFDMPISSIQEESSKSANSASFSGSTEPSTSSTGSDLANYDGRSFVESIVGKRVTNNEVEYQVKWVGFDSSQNTWHPTRELFCQAEIEAFEQAQNLANAKDANQVTVDSREKATVNSNILHENEAGDSSVSSVESISGKKMMKIGGEEVAFYEVKWKGLQKKSWMPVNESISADVLRYEKTKASKIGGVEVEINAKRRRSIRGMHFEPYDPSLKMESVTTNYAKGKIVVVVPGNTDANYEMFNVVRRLKRVACGSIIPNFFRCDICGNVIKANTIETNAIVKRHFKKCTGPVQVGRAVFYQLLQGVLDIGAEIGQCNVSAAVLPQEVDEKNVEECLSMIRSKSTTGSN